jgi:hypothetical protein
MLLRRVRASPLAAIERLAGIQSQVPTSPYVALWSRLSRFQHDDLASLLLERKAVRIALMRSTVHLVSSRDCLDLRPLLAPVLERSMLGTYARQLGGLELTAVADAGRKLIEEEPRPSPRLAALLGERWPGYDRQALANAVRALVPLIQIPPRGVWGTSMQTTYATAESWLGESLGSGVSREALVLRYLAAFGPATVEDVQVWSGLTKLRDTVDHLRPQLIAFRGENGADLVDLPRAPRPRPDTEAPPRFLAEYDNVLLSFGDRRRIISNEDRPRVYTASGVRPTVLVDGFVRGVWSIERRSDAATLVIEAFGPIARADRAKVTDEGARLLKFVAGNARRHAVRIVSVTKT